MNRPALRLAAFAALGVAICLVANSPSFAQEQKKIAARPVAKGLDNPSGVAVHPKNGQVYVATHAGVLRFKPGKEGGISPAITGFGTDVYGKGPKYNIGPLGVAFLNPQHLIVGDGSRPDGEELVRVFKLSDEAQTEKDAVATVGPITAGDESVKGEGNFYGLVVTDTALYVTCNGDDNKGWVSRAMINGRKLGELKPFIATKEATGVDAPVAITLGPYGDLFVGQMGEMNVPGDSLLTVYDAKTGKLKKNYETGLSDIAGLAFSPSGKLYAVDYSWSAPDKGGLFELTVEGDECTTKKIVSLDKPTALAFNKNGVLYISQFGTAAEGGKPAGALLRIRKGL